MKTPDINLSISLEMITMDNHESLLIQVSLVSSAAVAAAAAATMAAQPDTGVLENQSAVACLVLYRGANIGRWLGDWKSLMNFRNG